MNLCARRLTDQKNARSGITGTQDRAWTKRQMLNAHCAGCNPGEQGLGVGFWCFCFDHDMPQITLKTYSVTRSPMSKSNLIFGGVTLIIVAVIALMLVTHTGRRHVAPGAPAATGQSHM